MKDIFPFYVSVLKLLLHAVTNDPTEVIVNIPVNDEYNLVEACLQRIVDGVIYNQLTGRAYRRQLF